VVTEDYTVSDKDEDLADARLILLACGPVLEAYYERYGERITNPDVKSRTKAASGIILTQIAHDGCMAMEGFEVQDLLCRLSGLFTELNNQMKAISADSAAALAGLFAKRLGIYCGRFGGGDKRGHKQQVQYSATQQQNRQHQVPVRPPAPGRMGG
jgi:hypothetical protein